METFGIHDWAALRTWFDHQALCHKLLAEYESGRAEIIAFRQARIEERMKEIRVLSASTKAWQISIKGVIFRRWADALVKVKQSKDKMLKFLFKLKGVKLQKYLRAWHTIAQRAVIEPALARSRSIDEHIVSYGKDISAKENRIAFLTEKREIQVGIIKDLNQKVLDAEVEFGDPARAPTTLRTVAAGLVVPCHTLLPVAHRAVLRWASDLTREGVGTYRMGASVAGEMTPHMLPPNEWVLLRDAAAPAAAAFDEAGGGGAGNVQTVVVSEKAKNKWLARTTTGKKRLTRSRKDRKAEADAAAAAEVLSRQLPAYGHRPSVWTSDEEMESATLHSDEDTLYPIDTRIGQTMLRWLDSVVASGAARLLAAVAQSGNTQLRNLVTAARHKHTEFKHVLGGKSYAFLLHAIAPESTDMQFLLGSAVDDETRCKTICDKLSPGIRILTVDEMVGDIDDNDDEAGDDGSGGRTASKAGKSASVITDLAGLADAGGAGSRPSSPLSASSKSRPRSPTPGSPSSRSRKRSSSGRNRKEMISRQITYINGVKVEMEDDTEQRHFAFMAHMLALHRCFPSGAVDSVDASWKKVEMSEEEEGDDDNDAAVQLGVKDDLAGDGTMAEGSSLASWERYVEKASLAINMVKAEAVNSESAAVSSNELGIARSLDTLEAPVRDLAACAEKCQAPSRDLFCRFRGALYEREQLHDFESRSQMLGYLGCYQAVLGRDTVTEEDVDDGTFTGRYIKLQIGDLMRAETSATTGQKGLTDAEQDASVAELREFLVTHFRDSQMIFSHYAADSHTGAKGSMDRSEFWKLVKDLKLHKHLSGPEVDLIFQRSNLDASIDRSQNKNWNPDSELEAQEFVEALIRLSACKYKNNRSVGWVDKFKQMYLNDLLPCAKKTNKSGFRATALTDKQVKGVLQKERSKIRKMFNHFAAADTSSNTVGNVTSSTINAKELLQMCRTLNIMRPGILTDTTVRSLFAHVQMDEHAESGAQPGDDEEMNYEEFKEVLLALSFMLFPDPWTPPFKKLQQFLDDAFRTCGLF